MEVSTQLKDHEKRLRVVEAFMNADEQRSKGVASTFERIEKDLRRAADSFTESSEKLIKAVEERFASKNELEIVKKDLQNDMKLQASEGKWKARFIAASSSILTAIVLLIIGLLLPST